MPFAWHTGCNIPEQVMMVRQERAHPHGGNFSRAQAQQQAWALGLVVVSDGAQKHSARRGDQLDRRRILAGQGDHPGRRRGIPAHIKNGMVHRRSHTTRHRSRKRILANSPKLVGANKHLRYTHHCTSGDPKGDSPCHRWSIIRSAM